MIRSTRDGLPIIDPAWTQDELSDRGDPADREDAEEADDEALDSHLEQVYADAQTAGWWHSSTAEGDGEGMTPPPLACARLARRARPILLSPGVTSRWGGRAN